MLTGNPKVSVITACRNSAATIKDTIRSVVDQDYENLEYIIVDADSDDGTSDIIKEFANRIALWVREPDDGIADAWNKGIKKATGDIVGIINADDFYAPGTIAAIVDVFIRNPECGFVFGDLKMMNGSTGQWYRVFGRKDYEKIIRYNMLGIPHPTVFIKKNVYSETGPFSTAYTICADYEMISRIVAEGVHGVYLPRILTVMREGGLSERERILSSREVMDISVKYGANKLIAFFYFWAKCLRLFLGSFIDKSGISLSTQRRIVHSVGRRIFFLPTRDDS
jgi:glycosyltransferase involved in cell wall biosynthesis